MPDEAVVIDGQFVEESGRELALREEPLPVAHPAPLALFGDTPRAVVENMNAITDAIKESLVTRGMTTLMSRPGQPERRHVNVEGWTFLLQFLSIRAIIPRDGLEPFQQGDCTRHNPCGWRAYCELRKGGELLGAAWHECSRHENRWASRDEAQVKSMAQTRAIGKACRDTLGFVLAGLDGISVTPAEETEDASAPAPERVREEEAARGAAVRQAQAARASREQAEDTQQSQGQFIKTPSQFFAWAEQEFGYNREQVLKINNAADLNALRNIGLTKAIENVRVYRETVDSRGPTGAPIPGAAQQEEAESPPPPGDDEAPVEEVSE